MKTLYLLAFLFSLTLVHADSNTTDGYAPTLKNKTDTSVYDWNALDTKWINMRALGMIAVDGSYLMQDDTSKSHVGDLSSYNEANIRAIRIGAVGTINFERPWVYLIAASLNSLSRDFESGVDDERTLLDFLVGIPLWGDYARIQIGKMKAPISMGRNMGLIFDQVMERPMHLDTLLPSRNIGIGFSDMILDKRLHYRIGIYNDWLEKNSLSISQANQQYIGRLTAVAYEDKKATRLLHLGVGYRYDDIREGTLHYTTRPEEFYVDPWLNTGEFEAQSSDTYNLEFSYMDGPLWLSAEYTSTSVNSQQNDNPTFNGYHVGANYFITGEHRGYNYRLGQVRRVTPLLSTSDRGVGAIELSIRHSFMNLNSGTINGGEMDINALGIIWHPIRDIQLQAQYSRANLHNANMQPSSSTTKSKTDIIQLRVVLLIE